MGRKRVIKIPKRAGIKCVNCDKVNRIDVPADSCVYSIECKKCKSKIETPRTKCCIICAFSDKRCPISLREEARVKGLEVR